MSSIAAPGTSPPDRRPAWVAPLAVYLLAFAVAATLGLLGRYRANPAALDFDEHEYWQLAGEMLDGRFVPFPRRTAAWPLLLAGLRLASPGFLGVQLLVSAIYALGAPALWLLARRLAGGAPATGVAAGVLFALWPPFAFYGATLYSEPAALPLFLLALWRLPLGARAGGEAGPRLGQALVAGGVLALATQVRTMYLLFLPVAALILLLEDRVRPALARLLALVAGFAVLTLPWSVYMTARFGHPILVTANGGETLSGGLGPQLLRLAPDARARTADRSTWIGPGKWVSIPESGYLSPGEQARLPYDQQDALLRHRALAWAAAHPADAAYLQLCKLGYMWGVYRAADNGAAQLLLGHLAVVALAGLAGWLLWHRPGLARRTPRLWLLPLFVSGVALISWGSWRFRQPADAGLLALVALGLCGWRQDQPGGGSAR